LAITPRLKLKKRHEPRRINPKSLQSARMITRDNDDGKKWLLLILNPKRVLIWLNYNFDVTLSSELLHYL
jgi:hypothetical protein